MTMNSQWNTSLLSLLLLGFFKIMYVDTWASQVNQWQNKPACQCRRCQRHSFDPWVGKIPGRRKWQLTLVFLPGESHGQRSLAGYSPWGHKESDTIQCLSTARVGICFVIPLIKQYVPKGETERYHSLGVLQSGLEE